MILKDEMSPELKAHLKDNLLKTFNTNSLKLPENSQRKKPWANETKTFVSDYFQFKVRDIGGSPEQEPYLFLAGGPGLPHSSDYKAVLAPRNSKRALMFEPRCVGENQHLGVTFAESDEAKHQAFIKSLELNTLQNQVEDIEKARLLTAPYKKMAIRGDSWGTTVALAYAQKYPENVSALILNLPFLASADDFEMRRGKNGEYAKKYPNEYVEYLAAIDETVNTVSDEPSEIAKKFISAFASEDLQTRTNAFKAWAKWEGLCDRGTAPDISDNIINETNKIRTMMIVAHYHAHSAFLEYTGVLSNPEALKDIPVFIISNSHDPLVHPSTLVKLVESIPHAKIVDIPRATHSRVDDEDFNSINTEEMAAAAEIFEIRKPINAAFTA